MKEYLQKREEEFDELLRLTDDLVEAGAIINNNDYLNALKQFNRQTIIGVLEKMKEKLENKRESPPPYSANKENPMKHIYQNEGYNQALEDQISYLDEQIQALQDNK